MIILSYFFALLVGLVLLYCMCWIMRKMVRTLDFDSTRTHTGPRIPTWEYRFGARTDPPESHAAASNAFVRCYLVE